MNKNVTLTLLLALSYLVVNAQDYYVSNSGNDGNPGTLLQPFATIQHAANVATLPGSNVYIMAGTYQENIVTQNHSGTANNPITFTSYNNGLVYIDGGGTSAGSGSALWTIANVSFVTVKGIIFQNSINNYVKGLIITNNCNRITVRDCKFTNIHFSNNPADIPAFTDNVNPLLVYTSATTQPTTNISFINNEVYNCRTGRSESITVNGNVDGFLIDSNYVHDVTNIGIDAAGHYEVCPDPSLDQARNGVISNNVLHYCASPVAPAGSIYVDGGKNIVIENNRISYGQVGISVGCEKPGKTTSNITVRNNVCYKNSRTGIEIGGYDYPTITGKVTDCIINGNTCYQNDTINIWAGEINVTYNENLSVRNNILYSDNIHKVVFNYYPNNGPGNTFNYNLYYSPTGANNCMFTFDGIGYSSFSTYKSGTGNDLNSQFENPNFVDGPNFDFHLQSISPAIDAGDPLYTAASGEKDMNNGIRVFGIIDNGADESPYTANIEKIQADQVLIYPNPVTTSATLLFKNPLHRAHTLRIYDKQGRLIEHREDIHEEKIIIEVKGLATGVYFYELHNIDGPVARGKMTIL